MQQSVMSCKEQNGIKGMTEMEKETANKKTTK